MSAVYIDYVSHHMGFRENKLSSSETILTLHNPFHNMCRYCFQDTVQTIAQQVHLKPNNDKETKINVKDKKERLRNQTLVMKLLIMLDLLK